MNGSFFSQIYTNGAILSIFFYFSTPFLYACVFGMGLFFSARWGWVGGYKGLSLTGKESPCYTNSLSLFVLLNSEKNEQRNAAAVIGLLACRYGRRRGLRNSLRSNIPRPFPSVSSPLRLRRPIKAESGIVAFACILTPSVFSTPPSFGHLPYILLCKTPRNAAWHGRGRVWYPVCCCWCFFNPSVSLTPPSFGHLPYILLCKTPRNATGHGKGRVWDLILLLPMFFQPPPFFQPPRPMGTPPIFPTETQGERIEKQSFSHAVCDTL